MVCTARPLQLLLNSQGTVAAWTVGAGHMRLEVPRAHEGLQCTSQDLRLRAVLHAC